jgi:hypothetical protein
LSRSCTFLLAIAAISPAPAIAQAASQPSEADRAIAEQMMSAGGQITRDTSRNHCLRTIRQGEITVCAPDEDEFRIPSTADSDPDSAAALNDGRLHAPDVAGDGIFKGKSTMAGMCMLPPCPPEQPYLIDLSTIPEAPAGSDADKIAKGEMRAP